MKTKSITKIALLTAIYCIVSPFSIYIGLVPFTFSLFCVCLISSIADLKTSVTAILCYILLGLFGMPVFSGFTGGFQKLFEFTGGFIIGYIPMALLISFLVNKYKDRKFIYPLSYVSGTLICYLTGTVWFSFVTQNDFLKSITICVIPFIPFDILKIIVCSIIAPKIKKTLNI